MTATVIAVIAVVGLAHSFAVGRTLIDRYAAARAALTFAQGELERLTSLAAPGHNPAHQDLTTGTHVRSPAISLQSRAANETWRIDEVDDPVNGTGGPFDYKRATVIITWNYGGVTDSVTLSRTLPPAGP
jgi:hypothetical protein